MIDRLRKYEELVMKSKGHKHLYDRFDALVKDLNGLTEWDRSLTDAVAGIINQLLYEAGVTACTPFYPLYSLRCWTCAVTLNRLLCGKDGTALSDTLLRDIENLMLEKRVMVHMDESAWSAYTRNLFKQERWNDIRILIWQSIAESDCGRRPRTFYAEQALYNQLHRASILIHQYVRLTGDRSSLPDWIEKMDSNRLQSILYNLIKNGGDIRIIGLLIHSISVIEDLEIL